MAAKESALHRLWRPRTIARIAAPFLAIVILAILDQRRTDLPKPWGPSVRTPLHYAIVVVAGLIAIVAVNGLTRALGHAMEEQLGLARARATATFLSFILYCAVILLTINGAGLDLSGILVGGAFTGVVVGIAGQASLSNVIAGLVILFARPFSAGMYLTVRAGVFGGVEYSGQVWDISLFYTTLHSAGQEIRIPNSTMVAAVVVLRPQELDVYIPITFPPTTDLPPRLEALRRQIANSTAARRAPQVTLEKVNELGYIVGVRVFVAGESERRAIERAIAGVVRQNQEDLAAAAQPDAAAAQPDARDTGKPAAPSVTDQAPEPAP